MIEGIDHIALKVADIEESAAAFRELGYPLSSVEQHDEVGMKIAFLGDKDSGRMELMEVTSPDSPIAGDPDGLHHLSIAVADIDAAFAKMSADPLYRVQGAVRQGAHSRIFFFRIAAQPETLYECAEAAKEVSREC